MGYTRKKMEVLGFDKVLYEKYYHRHQSAYIRTRLCAVWEYQSGKAFSEVGTLLCIHWQSVRKYVNLYLSGGFKALCAPTVRPQPTLLTGEQEQSFKTVLLTQRPREVGLSGNIWTGELMCAYLEKTYQVVYKSGIYALLKRLRLSHQKAHFDYGNADVQQQQVYIQNLKDTLLNADTQTAVLMFDEFSISERPTAYYGWAEKNTRPVVVTNEKKRNDSMDY